MRIITEYRHLCEELAAAESELAREERNKQRLLRPPSSDLTGLDYSKDAVQTSPVFTCEPLLLKLMEINENIIRLKDEISMMKECKQKIEDAICKYSGVQKKALLYRSQGYTNKQVAWEMGLSKRQVIRIFSTIRRQTGEEKSEIR